MKIVFRLSAWPIAAASFLLLARLAAQDITVGDPFWFSHEPPPDTSLRTGTLRPKVPAELAKSDEIGFVVLSRNVGADGQILSTLTKGTHPPLERAVDAEWRDRDWQLPTVKREGKRVGARVWVPVIFNPKSAAAKGPDATPRLLAAAPALTLLKPAPNDQPQVVRMKLALDATGAITSATPVSKAGGNLLKAVEDALKEWRFAPARQGGQPVAAEIVVPVLCHGMRRDISNATPPRILETVHADYPLGMRRYSLSGRVTVDFTVTEEGRVTQLQIFESDNPAFDEAAIVSMRQWRYQPAMRDGKPVSSRERRTITFDYDNPAAFRVNESTDQSKLPPEFRYDTAARVRAVTLPVYPHALRRDAVRGKARATMLVDPRGLVSAVKVGEVDRPEFGHALAAALQGFKFDPAYRDGKPVQSMIGFEQVFSPFELPDEPGDDLLGLEKKSPDKILPIAKLDVPLKIVSRREPIFPITAAAGVTKGEAVVECLIDKTGRVRLPRIKSASDDAFGYAAVQAASGWWFEPPLVNGKPVVVREEIPFHFARRAPVNPEKAP